MDQLPFRRRPGVRTAAGVLLVTVITLAARRSAGPLLSPPAPVLVPLGILAAGLIFLFAGSLMPPPRSMWDYPWQVARGAGVLSWLGLHLLSPLPSSGLASLAPTLVQVDLAIVSLGLIVGLTAQFVLPVRSGRERWRAVTSLIRALFGQSGPVVFIHSGTLVETARERRRRGPGVLLVDPASGAVLRDDVRFTQTVGPGMTFTKPGERVAEALDLRRQVRRIPALRPAMGQEAEGRGASSLAVSRDGIPVSADLSVTFMLDPGHSGEPREGREPHQTPFEFNRSSASRAVYSGHAYGPQHEIPWTDLPPLLVVDLWREQVKGRDLSQLLSPGRGQPSPLEEIQRAVLARLTSPSVETPDPAGGIQTRPSREFKVLSERGIRVLRVDITGLVLPDVVADELTLHWREHWSGAIHEALTDTEVQAEEQRRQGQRRAYQILCEDLTMGLRAQLARSHHPAAMPAEARRTLNRRDSLAALLLDALRICARSEMAPDGGQLAPYLRRMRTEVLSLDANCQPLDLSEEP